MGLVLRVVHPVIAQLGLWLGWWGRPWGCRDWGFTALLAALAAAPRLYVALAWAREPVWDAHYYHFGAQRIASGLGYSEDLWLNGELLWRPWCHYPVGYSAALGGVYRVFGSGQAVGPLFNVVLGVLTVVVVHRLALRFLSPGRSRVAALLTAGHPGLIAYTAVLMTEPLAALSLLLIGLCAFASTHPFKNALTGFVVGLAALVRPPSLLALGALLVAAGKPWRKALIATAVAAFCAGLTIAPWTLRNCRVMDGCALISTNGGWNLAIGALTPTGRFHTLRAEDGCRVVTGQVQQDRCWAQVGRRAILSDPGAWLSKIPAKLAHTFNHESFPLAYLGEADPTTWHPAHLERGRIVLTLFHQLLMVVALFSAFSVPFFAGSLRAALLQSGLLLSVLTFVAYCVLSDQPLLFWLAALLPLLRALPLPGAPSHNPTERYLLSLVLIAVLTSVLFFGEDRYHMVVSPTFCILAAAALRSARQPRAPQTGAPTCSTQPGA